MKRTTFSILVGCTLAAIAPAQNATKPATAAAAPAQPARNIRFQFDGMPYADVIERFAQMAGKPLIADTNITGTITYNDPTAYSYSEALDTLNIMLSMKGVMLVESGNYLRLVPFKELPAMPLRILRGADATGDVRPGEVVTVVLDVKNLESKEIADSITAMLSNAGSVAALPKGRGLIVTDRLANIQRVRTLLATIDIEATVNRQMKTYTLLNASGAIVSDLLNRTFGVATAPKRTTYNPNSKAMEVLPPDPNDYITSVYDEASRTLVLFGPTERLGLAEELINKFEQKDGPGGDVRIYFPQSIKADELANLIRQAIPGVAAPNETAANSSTKARVISDASQNRLIVAAPIPGQLEQIDQLISRIDKGAVGTVGGGATNVPLRSQSVQLTKVFRPRAAESTNLASIITQALTRRSPSGQMVTTASVSHDPASGSVVVSGSPGDLQIATDIVAQLETGTTRPVPLKTQFIDVGSTAEAKRIQPMVEQLYRDQASAGAFSSGPHAKIMADADSGRLIVTASEEHLGRIEEIVRQLRSDKAQGQTRRLQIITLKNSRAETALPGIQNLVNDRMSERRFSDVPKPSILADAPNNRLLVTATDDQIAAIQQVVQVIDVAPVAVKREMRVIPLRAKPAAEVIPTVTALLEQTAESPSNPLLAPKLMADPTGKQIIALAMAADFERIEKLVAQFDATAATSAPRQFRGVELFGRNATELTPLVTQLYTEQLRGQPEPPGGPATLLAETKENRIMVSGAEQEIARVEAIIRQLDPAGRKGSKEETRVIRMKAALAAELASLVEKSLNAQSQHIKVLVDARSNSLVISGDSAAVEAASEVIRQLDTRSDVQPREMRIIELKQGDANTISGIANNLATELIKDQRGPDYAPQTRITPDATSNRLIVSGPKDELNTVSKVVEQLDQAPEAAGGARVFKLVSADAAQVVGVVSNAMLKFDNRNKPIQRVTISLDRESNSIIIAGPRNDLKDAESIIQRLDGEGIDPTVGGNTAGKARELKIMDVQSADVDGLAALAMKVFSAQNAGRTVTNLVSITPEPNGKRLIVLAPATVLPQVETVVSTLDSKPDQGVRELHVVETKNASVNDLLPNVQRIYAEQTQGHSGKPATIYPDSGGRRLAVFGTKEQAAQVQQIVDVLASEIRAPRETKTFDFGRLAEAQRVMPIAQQLYRDQLVNNPGLGAADAQMISDGKTGRLIVSARADQLKIIEEIVSRLQITATTNQASRETRSFEVGSAADVQRLQPLVQQLYTDQWRDKAETDPADAQIVADPRAGRIIVTGKPEHVKQIEVILQQLGTNKARTEARDTRIFDLTTASAVELAATVRTLYLEQAKARLGAQQPDTMITPDAGGNRLIVVGDTNELNEIEGIIQKLDKVSAQSASARVFKLKSADPQKVSEILTTSLVRYDAYGRPQKRATVSVDAKTRTLIVTGDPKELGSVATIIEQLDQSLGAQPDRKMKVLTLKQGKVGELLGKVRQLYNDQLTAQPDLATTDILMMEDAASNQLLLAGNERQIALVEQILDNLQAAAMTRGERETKFIEVGQVEELNRLMPLVQQLYQERWKHREVGDPADAFILTDPKNGRFIVTGRTNHLVEIEKIVAQLRATEAGAPRDTRIYDLSTANAAELATTVRSLYLDQAKTRPAAQPQETLILPDGTSNRLIVAGTTNELNVVEDIIKKLDKVSSQSGTVRLFKLKSADPNKVMEVLGNALMSYDAYGKPRRRVGITVDTKTRTIVVAGDPKELQALQNASVIIEQLDSALGAQADRKIKVVALKQGKAAELSPKVRQLYNDQLTAQPDLAVNDVLIMEDGPANQLILAGSEPQLKVLEGIITDLQSASINQGPRETKIFPMAQGEDVSKLQGIVQQLYQDRWKSRDAGDPPDAQLIADATNGRLVVTGRTNHLAEVTGIVEMLKEAGAGSRRDVHVVSLQRNSAQAVSSMINQLFAKQVASVDPADRLVLSALPDDRTLVVEAAEKTFERVSDVVKKIDDTETTAQNVIQTVHLKKGRADNLAEAINAALTNRVGTTLAKRVSVTPVLGANSLLINGPTNAVEDVMKIVRELDTESEAGDIEVRIYKLENGVAKEVSGILEDLLQNVSRYQARTRTGRFIQANVSIDSRANSLIIAGTPAHFAVVEKILPTLDKQPERSDRDVQFIWLRKAKAYDVVSKVEAVFDGRDSKEKPVIEADTMNNSVTVIARRGDLAQIQDLINRLDDSSKDTSMQVRLRPLERVAAEQMAKMLQNIYPQMGSGQVRVVEKSTVPKAAAPGVPGGAVAPQGQQQNQPATTPAPATTPTATPAQPGAQTTPDTNAVQEVVISVDKVANALILSGPAQELDHLDRIITDLSFNFWGNESEFRLFPLKDADPVVAARTLTDLLRQEPVPVQRQPGQPPQMQVQQPKITVVAEPRTRSIIVRARPTDFPLLETLINQLDAAGQVTQVEFRVVPLTNAPPEKVLPLVQQMVTQLSVTRPGEPLSVSIDARSRGLLVVGRDTVLTQVEKMIRQLDTPSQFTEADVLVVSLKKANAAQLAGVLQGILRPVGQGETTVEARELQEQVRRLKIQNEAGQSVLLDLSKPIKISADPVAGQGGANRLILSSTGDNLKALGAVVAMMDTVPVTEDVVIKLMPLKFADANTVAQTLNTIFTQGKQLANGPTGPNAQPSGPQGKALVNPLNVAIDARANTVILSGQIETMNLAMQLVADMDKSLNGFVTEVKLFRLKHASATKMVPLLQSVFTEGPSVPGTEGLSTQVSRLKTFKEGGVTNLTAAPKTRTTLTIQADDLANILVVAARSDMLPLIGDVIDQLDIPAASGLETVRIYPLTHADPAAIQKILNDIYTSPRAATAIRVEDRPVISVDARTSALVVAGNSKSFGVIEGLLAQLDQKLAFELRDIRIIPLDNADATVVAASVQRLMDARVTQRASLNQGTADTLKVTILADQRSNALLVAGGRESFDMVESLAKQLDKASPALSGRIRLIALTNADSRVIAATLTTLFTQRYASQRAADVGQMRPIILADPRSNSLIVTANQEDNATIDDLLKRLDTKPENPSLTLTVLPLKKNDSARVASVLKTIFAARLQAQALPGQPALPSEQIEVQPDPLNNALIISASKENLELIQGLVAKLDLEPTIEGGMLQTFTLQFADAQRVATMLNSLVRQGLYHPGQPLGGAGRAASGRDALAISVDPRSNTLFVSASPENLMVVKSVIEKVDTKDFSDATNMRVYTLKNAKASTLATTLEQFFRAKRTADSVAVNANERSIPVSVLADDRINSIIVTGTKEAFDAVERLMPQLDGDSTFHRLNFRVFALKKATAQKLQQTLQPIFANRPPKVKGEPNDPITIMADPWVNALLVGASADDMSTVESLIDQLDADATDRGLSIHVFPLAKADARRVATTVQSLFRENTPGSVVPVQVNADERINAIVVSCGETDAKRIGELVKKLDTEQVARVSEIRVFPLKFARADALSTILNTAMNTKPTPLTEQSPNAQSVLQFISRTEGGQEFVTAALKEGILITPDARMNSLIVSGPVDYMGLMEQIITRLDASSPQQAKIKVFPLKNADAAQMARLLMQLFRMTQTAALANASQRSIQYTLVRSSGNGGGEQDAASATVGTAEQNALTITVDPRTNSLLVGGTDHYVTLVSQIIDSLDASEANERRTEVVRLKNSQAQDVARAIRDFLDQEKTRTTQGLSQDELGTAQRMLEREVAVVAEQLSNTLLVSANPRYFEQIKSLIDELDKAQPQVLIQVLLAEVTLDKGLDLGMTWTYNNVPFAAGIDIDESKWIETGFASAVTGGNYSFLLQALEEDGRLEVLSRPQIVTADNKPATINIGQRVPLITDSRVTERGDTINSFRYEDVGVNLSVTPKISPDGMVKMDIGTTNSALSSSSVEINSSATVPIINQRRATTTVSVPSGQTILIGGLIATTDDKRTKKVPWLGDIPVIGAMFRKSHNTRERKELLVLLTPQILSNSAEASAAKDIEKLTREQLDRSRIKDEIQRDDLQKQLLDPLFPEIEMEKAPVKEKGDKSL